MKVHLQKFDRFLFKFIISNNNIWDGNILFFIDKATATLDLAMRSGSRFKFRLFVPTYNIHYNIQHNSKENITCLSLNLNSVSWAFLWIYLLLLLLFFIWILLLYSVSVLEFVRKLLLMSCVAIVTATASLDIYIILFMSGGFRFTILTVKVTVRIIIAL